MWSHPDDASGNMGCRNGRRYAPSVSSSYRGLHRHVVDYGDARKSGGRAKRESGYGEEAGKNQCVLLPSAAGIDRHDQGKKRRPTCATMAMCASQCLRDAEMRTLQESERWCTNPASQMAVEIRIISRNAARLIRRRDVRTSHLPHPRGNRAREERN